MRKKTLPRVYVDGPPSGKGTVPIIPGPEASALLGAFRALSTSDVYTMAPKASVVRGYQYYEQQRLLHYIWSQDRAKLTAQVEGTRLYTVIFSLDDGFLAASCDCPAWDPDWLCKHVLCACFATKHLLSPETFRLPDRRQARLATLRAELFGDLPEPRMIPNAARKGSVRPAPAYEIVIDARQPYLRLLIHRNGAPLTGGWAPALPPELVPLLNTSWFSSGFGEEPLLVTTGRRMPANSVPGSRPDSGKSPYCATSGTMTNPIRSCWRRDRNPSP